ncbi:TPA: hypothetical protein NG287_002431 [Vibrio parahaemolyticus]|nr:hypothetical protein [Vibrio parahaemolyticus]HCG7350112.1 hypothetical protein [Vibrio parahaemolyticus]
MCDSRKKKQRIAAEKLASFLSEKLNKDKGYPDIPTWGYAFSALFNQSVGGREIEQELALKFLSQQDKDNKEYSWEFVTFSSGILTKNKNCKVPDGFEIYHEKGTRMFNWFLLRCHNKLLFKRNCKLTLAKLKIALSFYQMEDGLILDEFKTRSLHYHAFCLFVLAHILRENDIPWLKLAFQKGVKCAMNYILKDGTALYIGRGQEQIFGYGALLYSLEFYNSNISQDECTKVEKVSNKVISFQRSNGSFPLVLRTNAPEEEDVSFKINKPCGWHGYNTLYDYLPFLGYCLSEVSKLR